MLLVLLVPAALVLRALATGVGDVALERWLGPARRVGEDVGQIVLERRRGVGRERGRIDAGHQRARADRAGIDPRRISGARVAESVDGERIGGVIDRSQTVVLSRIARA